MPNNALRLTAASLCLATLCSGFRQQLKAGVRRQAILCFLACYTYNQPRTGDQYGTREGKLVVKTGIFAMALLVNAVALFCIFNPWITDWQGQGIVVLVVEAAAVVVIGAPVFFYHVLREQKPLKQSLVDTVRVIMDFLAGWV